MGAHEQGVVDATRRTRLALERTYLAWWRTGLTCFAVSFAAGRLVPDLSRGANWPYEVIGIAFAVVGVASTAYGYVRNREGYNYLHHAEVGSDNAEFVTDDVVDRFTVIGPVEDHIAKLKVLAEAGVDQFNIYLMNGDEEQTLDFYAREIIPATKGLVATHP